MPVECRLPASLPPLLRRLYAARGLRSGGELELGLAALAPPQLLGMDAACRLLAKTLEQEGRILVVGDFDADGATGCAVAMRGLRALGARQVDYLVPDRFSYGYGLSPEIVHLAAERRPQLLITVDNGISSHAGVETARSLGLPVLVTDHHLPGKTLPAADAIVNPNQPDCQFPSKHLAGVGVMFYLLVALRGHLRQTGWFQRRSIGEPRLASLLDLVAFGTVADVVPLDHNNRILVEQGLRRIRAAVAVPGILALAKVAERDPRELVAADLGFALGPRLNAAGRLEDMSEGVACLLTDDPDEALALAQELDVLNRDRRLLQAQMEAQASAAVQRLAAGSDGRALPSGLCLHDVGWHQGIVGLVAARIRERTQRPVVAFALDRDGWLKGSARSVPGLHLRDTLADVAACHPGLLERLGGHAAAAGLSLEHSKLEHFRTAFDEAVRKRLGAQPPCEVIWSDGELDDSELIQDTAETLRQAGPWGQGFPEPVFDGNFEVMQSRVVGERHLRLSLRTPGARAPLAAIAFGAAEQYRTVPQGPLRIAYRLGLNNYRGIRSLQLVVEHLES
jgi:single-stranded-DNA-specific exonuclease